MNQSPQMLLLDVFDQRCATYAQQHKLCYNTFSEDSVHELRVTIRRLLALIELLCVINPQLHLKKLRHACKSQLDVFGKLRDIQVILAIVTDLRKGFPEQDVFQAYLLQREKKLLQSTQKKLKAIAADTILSQLNKVRRQLAREEENVDDLEIRLLMVVDDAYSEVMKRHQCVDQNEVATIHRVRISFKKFRHMAEIVQSILSIQPPDYSKRMHHYQAIMGDIQDSDVLLSELLAFARSTTWYDVEPMRRFYNKRHAKLITTYLTEKDTLFDLWRKTPSAPFPWQSVV